MRPSTDMANQDTRVLNVHVSGMSCRHCVRDATRRLRDVPGVETVVADAAASLVVLTGTMTPADVGAALARSSYVIEEVHDGRSATPTSEGGTSNDD